MGLASQVMLDVSHMAGPVCLSLAWPPCSTHPETEWRVSNRKLEASLNTSNLRHIFQGNFYNCVINKEMFDKNNVLFPIWLFSSGMFL